MLKIPEEGKLIDAGKFYQEAYNTYQRELNRMNHRGSDEVPRFQQLGETVVGIIGELAYDMPPVDAKPVVHGHWLARQHDDGHGPYVLYHCSECDCHNAQERFYCPECGSKMDGK